MALTLTLSLVMAVKLVPPCVIVACSMPMPKPRNRRCMVIIARELRRWKTRISMKALKTKVRSVLQRNIPTLLSLGLIIRRWTSQRTQMPTMICPSVLTQDVWRSQLVLPTLETIAKLSPTSSAATRIVHESYPAIFGYFGAVSTISDSGTVPKKTQKTGI